MPEEIKIKKTRSSKPRAKASDGTIKIKRVKKTPTPLEEAITVNASVPVEEIQPARPLYEDPFVEEMIASKVGNAPGRWPFRLYRNIAVTFVVLAVLTLAAVGYFAFVRLDIGVTPRVTAVEGKTTFKIYDRPADYSVPEGSTLGVVRAMEVEWTQVQPASGKKVSGAELSGTVTIINNYTKDQPLVASTRLLTPDNQLLRLRDTVSVPAGGRVDVEVYGEASDPSFSLADARLTIPGLWAGLQDQIYAEAKAGSVKYQEKGESFVTEEDIKQAESAARAALIEKAKNEIEATYSNYGQRLYSLDEKSLKTDVSAEAGEAATEVKVTMSGSVTVAAFNEDGIKNLSNTALEAAAPAGGSVIDTPASKPTYELISADTKDNVAEVEMTVAAQAATTDPETLIDRTKIISLHRAQLEEYLKSLPAIESYELKFTPSFWPMAPQLADRISVHLK